ncbi:hypothetical protein, partial [Erwinia amylovora]|uniref:hypothetical protein n=1 Tax=Erwinia amylovora TaxID=552 RepID=UPI0020BDF9EC
LAAATCAAACATALARGASPTECVYVFIVSGAIAYSYFHLFNMSLTARRIHLLIRQLGQEVNPGERYDAARVISLRLARLEQMGILREEGG